MRTLSRFVFLIGLVFAIVMQFVLLPTPKAYAYSNPASVPLGTVSNFAALAASTVTSPTGPTILNNGDMGTNLDCTDFPTPCSAPNTNGTINNGTVQKANSVATTGQTDATAAVTNIGLRTSDQTVAGGLLDNLTLTQGVYTIPAATTNLTGDLTLSGDANSVFIFHATSTLITANGSRVILTGGAQACNIFWKVDSSATFNGATTMIGTVLAQASTSFPGGGAILTGRVVAQTAAITFNNTTINNTSTCAATTKTTTTTTTTSTSSDNTVAIPASSESNVDAPTASSNKNSHTKLPHTGLFKSPSSLDTIAIVAISFIIIAGLAGALVLYLKKRKFLWFNA
jgi:type VI secretion system secreted protein VgrG